MTRCLNTKIQESTHIHAHTHNVRHRHSTLVECSRNFVIFFSDINPNRSLNSNVIIQWFSMALCPFFLLSISLSHRVIHVAFCRDCSFLLHHWHKAFVLAPFCCFQRCFSKIFATCVIVCFVVATLWQIGGSVCVFDFNVCPWYCVCRDLWHCQGFEFEMFCSKDVYEF